MTKSLFAKLLTSIFEDKKPVLMSLIGDEHFAVEAVEAKGQRHEVTRHCIDAKRIFRRSISPIQVRKPHFARWHHLSRRRQHRSRKPLFCGGDLFLRVGPLIHDFSIAQILRGNFRTSRFSKIDVT